MMLQQLALALYTMCLAETIPNEFTVSNLPQEQRELIYAYAEAKCKQRVEFYIGGAENPMCEDYNTECM